MKASISPLHPKAKAAVPEKVTNAVELRTLRPLAFQFFLLIVYRWNQRVRTQLARIAPSQRLTEHFTFTTTLRELQAHLRPEASGLRLHHDYRHIRDAIGELSRLQVTRDLPDVKGKRGQDTDTLIISTRFREEGNTFTYTLSPFFREALQALEARQGAKFTLVPIADALALNDSRHLLMLVLIAGVAKLRLPKLRTFSVEWLLNYFGITLAACPTNAEALRRMRGFADAVNERTSFKFTLTPVVNPDDSRRIDALRFDPVGIKFKAKDEFEAVTRRKPKPSIKPKGFAFGALARAQQQRSKPRIRRPHIEDRDPESFPQVDDYQRLREVALRAAPKQRERVVLTEDEDGAIVFGDIGEA